MKKTIAFCLCLLVQQLFAQNSVQLKIEDAESHLPLNGAIVALQSSGENEKSKIYFSDFEGKVAVPVDHAVTATISLIGYQTVQDTLTPSNENKIILLS